MKIPNGSDRPELHVSRQHNRRVMIAQERGGMTGWVRIIVDLTELRAVADSLHDIADDLESTALNELTKELTTT